MFGAAYECRSRHFDDAHNEAVPRCFYECGSGIKNLHGAALMAVAFVRIDGFMARQGGIFHRDLFDFPQQTKLIFLNLNK